MVGMEGLFWGILDRDLVDADAFTSLTVLVLSFKKEAAEDLACVEVVGFRGGAILNSVRKRKPCQFGASGPLI